MKLEELREAIKQVRVPVRCSSRSTRCCSSLVTVGRGMFIESAARESPPGFCDPNDHLQHKQVIHSPIFHNHELS